MNVYGSLNLENNNEREMAQNATVKNDEEVEERTKDEAYA
jgi:gamma-glutamylcyclotransferase (GGCT)/AIG2-like uncharacterized protein YtfP